MSNKRYRSLTKVVIANLIVIAAFVAGCSTTGSITPTAVSGDDPNSISRGVGFVLPKTVLELGITYSLYDKVTWQADPNGNPIKTDKEGNPIPRPDSVRVVLVDKPISISAKTIPDSRMCFAFDTDSLQALTKKTDITINLSEDGFIKTTNLIVEDKAKEIVEDIAETTVGLAKLAAVAGTDVSEMILLEETTVTRLIDPADLEFTEEGAFYTAQYSDFEKAEFIFEDLAPPEITLRIAADVDLAKYSRVASTDLKCDGLDIRNLDGIPYRIPGAARVILSMDDIEVYSNYHVFAQAGGVTFIPINAEAFSDIKQGLEFAGVRNNLVKYSSKVTAQGKALSGAAKEATATIIEGAEDLRTAEIEAKLDVVKKEKELVEAETALAEAIEKHKEATESHD